YLFFFSSRRRHTRFSRDWSSDVCSSDLAAGARTGTAARVGAGARPCGRVRGARRLGARPYEKTGSNGRTAERERARAGRGGGRRSEERRVGKECRSGGTQQDREEKTQ